MQLPDLSQVEGVGLRVGEIFVAAAGFEDRVFAFPESLGMRAQEEGNAILLDYLPRSRKNRADQLNTVLSGRGLRVTMIDYNRLAPDGFGLTFRDAVIGLKAERVCLDISGMSRLAIMIIVDVCRELNLYLRVVYAEAEHYAPGHDEFEAARRAGNQRLPTSFIHTGVYDVVHVSRLSSVRMQNRATLLIAFDSFNEGLCQALVNVMNPARFILINGRPPRGEFAWREKATAYVHQRLREEWSLGHDNDPVKVSSTLRYRETYELLAEIYWNFSADHRIVVAPTGSKMQTLGTCFLRAAHEDVHVEYPTVEGFFADKYSAGVHRKWEVRFGKLNDLVESVRLWEREVHLGLPSAPVDAEIQ